MISVFPVAEQVTSAGAFPGLSTDEIESLLGLMDRPRANCHCRDPLSVVSRVHSTLHQMACRAYVRRLGTVVVMLGDNLTLVNNDFRITAQLVPDTVRMLDSIERVPLSVFLMVECFADGISEQSEGLIEDLRTQSMMTLSQLGNLGLTEEQTARQAELLAMTIQFLDSVLSCGRLDSDVVASFVMQANPLLEQNHADSTQRLFAAFDTQLSLWKSTFPDFDWENLRAVVVRGQFERRERIAVEYFLRLHRYNEGESHVYFETADDVEQALLQLRRSAFASNPAEEFSPFHG